MVAIVLSGVLVSCSNQDVEIGGVPAGWDHAPGRWWQSGVDTSLAFRPLDSLDDMGVSGQFVYASSAQIARQSSLQRDQLTAAVKQSLIRLYRNEPEVVDSLFGVAVAPLLQNATLQGDPSEIVERNKKKGYQAIRRHFREPAPVLELGEDIPVPFPDSLRDRGVSGAVRMQVRVDSGGEPEAIMLIDGVHPTLNEIAMRATTQMRWSPAYLLQKNQWLAVPSWARFTIHFATPD